MIARPTVWLVLVCSILAALTFSYFPYQLDDAFITYRYANHLATHGTLAFNLGEAPVEGFSSPLWLALLSLAVALGDRGAAPNAAFVLGLSFAIAACLLLYRLASASAKQLSAGTNPWLKGANSLATYAGIASVALLVACPSIPYYAATGLEPMLFLTLLLGSLASLTRSVPSSLGVVCAIALPWSRPEALACPVLWSTFLLIERTKPSVRRQLILLAPFCASLLALLVARLWLFNDLLPNTYYAKLPDRMRGLRYVWEIASNMTGGSLISLGALGAFAGTRWHRALFITALLWLLVAAAEGGDWMPLGRFAIPAFACLAGAASGVLVASPRWVHAVAAIATGAFLYGSYDDTTTQLAQSHELRRTLVHEYEWLSSWIEKTPAQSIALMDIGLIGYETDLRITDLAGLTDRAIARMEGHHLRKRIDPAYVLRRQPDLIVVRVEKPPMSRPGVIDPNAAMTQIEGDLLISPTMIADYNLVMMMLPSQVRGAYYGKIVFAHSSLSIAQHLLPRPPIFSLEPLPD